MRDDTIRTDSQGLARQAMLDAARDAATPKPKIVIATETSTGRPIKTTPPALANDKI